MKLVVGMPTVKKVIVGKASGKNLQKYIILARYICLCVYIVVSWFRYSDLLGKRKNELENIINKLIQKCLNERRCKK